MRPHERLDLWKKSVDFSVEIYAATESFPRREWYGLAQQVRKAAVSISSNISEGLARKSKKEMLHFLTIAQGSAAEVATQMLIAKRLGYVDNASYIHSYRQTDNIGKMITGLQKSIRKNL